MLNVGTEFRKGILFVRLSEILNKNTSVYLSNKLDNFINEMGVKYFVINIEDISYMDKDGIKILEDKYEDVIMHDGKLILCGYKNIYLNEIKEYKNINSVNNELAAFNLIRI